MRLLFLSLLFLHSAHASFSEHLKKCPDKSGQRSLRNIDFIYLINLDQRPAKLQRSLQQLLPFGIAPCRFSAVNGWELSVEALNAVGLKYSPEMQGGIMATCYHPGRNFEPSHEIMQHVGQTYFGHCLSRGAIGCCLSHLSVLQDAFDSGYETIWVMEDDIEVLQDPRLLSDLIDRLDLCVGHENWDILFTDHDIRDGHGNYSPCYWGSTRPDWKGAWGFNDYRLRVDVSEDFRRIGARWGAHSMILRRSGIQKLLQFFAAHPIFFPYDMEYIIPLGIKMFNTRQNIVSNLVGAASDNGGPNYLEQSNTQ